MRTSTVNFCKMTTKTIVLALCCASTLLGETRPLPRGLTDSDYQRRKVAAAALVKSYGKESARLAPQLLAGLRSNDPELAYQCRSVLEQIHSRYIMRNFPARLPIRRGLWLFNQRDTYENYVRVRQLKIAEDSTPLREGDVIMKINGHVLNRQRPSIDLDYQLANREVGASVELVVRRAGKDKRANRPKREIHTISVQLVAADPPAEEDELTPEEKEDHFIKWLAFLEHRHHSDIAPD